MSMNNNKWKGGWFPVWAEDLKVIGNHFGRSPGRERAPAIKATYMACCQLSNEREFQPFIVNIALIASIAAVGYKTCASALKKLAEVGLIRIENTTPGGLDAPRRYTVSRTVEMTERSPVGVTDQLPTSSYNPTNITSPPPLTSGVFAGYVRRFIGIQHPAFETRNREAIEAILFKYEHSIIESALADLERDGPGFQQNVNAIKKLHAYLQEAERQSTTPTIKSKGKRKPSPAPHAGISENLMMKEALL